MLEYEVVHTIGNLPDFNPDLPVFCDIETDGLYINTRLIQYYQPETDPKVYILDVEYWGRDKIPMFKRLGRSLDSIITEKNVEEFHKPLHIVYWNGSYDQGTLKFGSKKVDDLWYMAKTALPLLGEYTLDVVVDHLFPGRDFYQGLNKKELQKARFRPGPLSEDQLRYSATDVYVMKFLWDKLYPAVGEKLVYRVNKINLGYTVRWQQTGLHVNTIEHSKAVAEHKDILTDVTSQLPEGLNVNSYIQVRKLLQIDKSDEEALLHQIAGGCPYSRNILLKRSTLKTLKFLDTYNREYVYGFYNPLGTRTGRWSCKGGDREDAANLQQLPRKLKHVFGYEEEDKRIFVGADLPTAELRLASAVYEDHTMYQAFKDGVDLHKLTASKTTGISQEAVTSEQRKKAKAQNFGLLYGMKADKFIKYAFTSYDLVLSMEEATEMRDNWMNLYHGIRDKILEVTNQFYRKSGLIVQTPMGLPVAPNLYTDALNIPIQGAVAEISKLWIHYLFQMHNKGVHEDHWETIPIANFVHDSVTIETTEDKADYWKELLIESEGKAWREYCKLPMIKLKDIPMPIEVGISKSYGGAS